MLDFQCPCKHSKLGCSNQQSCTQTAQKSQADRTSSMIHCCLHPAAAQHQLQHWSCCNLDQPTAAEWLRELRPMTLLVLMPIQRCNGKHSTCLHLPPGTPFVRTRTDIAGKHSLQSCTERSAVIHRTRSSQTGASAGKQKPSTEHASASSHCYTWNELRMRSSSCHAGSALVQAVQPGWSASSDPQAAPKVQLMLGSLTKQTLACCHGPA